MNECHQGYVPPDIPQELVNNPQSSQSRPHGPRHQPQQSIARLTECHFPAQFEKAAMVGKSSTAVLCAATKREWTGSLRARRQGQFRTIPCN